MPLLNRCFVMGAFVLLTTQAALAQVTPEQFAALSQRLADAERRLAVQEQQGTRVVNHEPYCFACDTVAGYTFNAEMLFLKPYHSEGESPNFELHPASRLSFGWTNDNGLGIRARWLDYHNHHNDPALLNFTTAVDLTVVDLEVTDKFDIGHWLGQFSAGLRYADYLEFSFFDLDGMFDSWGPVLGVEVARPLTDQWDLLVSARDSLQYAPKGADQGALINDVTFNIAEVQLGVQYRRRAKNGGYWFARGAFEAQYWSGGVIGDGDTEDMGLVGGLFAVGLNR
ncbi:MAG: hypothetical protein KDB14_07025 [Planctomycetales bacterium]|nr:hypothetical protein [Planctomycetales bacterium]